MVAESSILRVSVALPGYCWQIPWCEWYITSQLLFPNHYSLPSHHWRLRSLIYWHSYAIHYQINDPHVRDNKVVDMHSLPKICSICTSTDAGWWLLQLKKSTCTSIHALYFVLKEEPYNIFSMNYVMIQILLSVSIEIIQVFLIIKLQVDSVIQFQPSELSQLCSWVSKPYLVNQSSYS